MGIPGEEVAKGSNWNFSDDSDGKTQRMRLGLIADHAPDLLYLVRNDTMSLNAPRWGDPESGQTGHVGTDSAPLRQRLWGALRVRTRS